MIEGYPNGGRGVEGFWAFLPERYRILLRGRAGEPGPWTDDPVLRAWRFCNVRREDDRVTTWFREEIREPLRDDPRVLFATIAFRWFNTIETGEAIRPWLLGPWDRAEVLRVLEKRLEAGHRLFTGAFMINSAPGKPKHIDVLDNLDWCLEHFVRVHPCATKEAAFNSLLAVPRLGNFAAYQVVVDLQYTYLLEDAPDLDSFTVAGPGCAKGIGLMLFDEPDVYRYGSKEHQRSMVLEMIGIHRDQDEYWPAEWPRLPLSDIENGFCEYAKWRSGHAGSRLKRRFSSSPLQGPAVRCAP